MPLFVFIFGCPHGIIKEERKEKRNLARHPCYLDVTYEESRKLKAL
jgi:hypothetical protein